MLSALHSKNKLMKLVYQPFINSQTKLEPGWITKIM